MTDHLAIQLKDKTVYLLAEKCAFFPYTQTLVIADIHLGKAVHFRKSGIMIPPQAGTVQDYRILHHVIQKYKPLRILFLGDLFHSVANTAWQHFADFTTQYNWLTWVLIQGNHDILPAQLYREANLQVCETLQEDGLLFSHAPLAQVTADSINIAGHIHPATSLRGLGKQTLKLPCFHFAPPYFLLPAFGSLTGTFVLPKGDAQQFVVTGKTVRAI